MTRSASPPYDPRAVANLLLDLAKEENKSITNLALQKLLYFAHGHFLTSKETPLVSGYFEAWQYGPVHPLVYRAFDAAGAAPITLRAQSTNLMTGVQQVVGGADSPEVVEQLKSVLIVYGRMTAGRLVEISHARNAPWAFIKEKGARGVALGFRIPDDVIRDRFKYHKVSIADVPRYGEPVEDSPFA
jgi:uncharacterized phage-associated protein